MEIKFIIDPDVDADDYKEIYTVEVMMEDGTFFSMSANSNEITYEGFRSDVFEDLFMSLAESTGVTVLLEEDDYSNIDGMLEDYVGDPDSGC